MGWFGRPQSQSDSLTKYSNHAFATAANEFQKLQLMNLIHDTKSLQKAYRVGAHRLHPNKVSRLLSPDQHVIAQAAAHADFIRLKDAYDVLARYGKDPDFLRYLTAYRSSRVHDFPLPTNANGWSIM